MTGRVGPSPAAVRTLGDLDRRGFLRLLGGVAALLPTAGGGCTSGAPGDGGALTAREARVLQAAVAAFAGPAAARRIAAGAVDPVRVADGWLAALPERAPALRGALWLLELGIWPLSSRLRPFTALDAGGREEVLRELSRSRFGWKRALFRGLKSFCCLIYYASPGAWPEVGYPGPFGGPDGGGIEAAMHYDTSALGYARPDAGRAPAQAPAPDAAGRARGDVPRRVPCTPPSTPRRTPTSPPPSSSPADG